jgi:hypothetical protein
MKRLIVVIVLVLTVSCLIFGQAKKQTQATSAEQELIQLENDWSDAAIKKDVAVLDRILADEATFTGSEGNLSTKAEMVADLKSGTSTVSSLVVDKIKARVWGDTGMVWGRTTEKSQYKGKDSSGQYQWTDTWIKLSGRWQCIGGQTVKVVKK